MLFRISVVLILAVFYSCYFLKMYHQKRRGIETAQIGKDKEGIVLRIEQLMKIATYLVPAVELISILLGTHGLPFPFRAAGIIVGITGDIFFILAVLTMKDNWRAGVQRKEKTELVTNGVFAISRNPAFLGFDLVYLGILMMFFNFWLFFASMFAIIMLHLQIVNVEEDFCLEAFGNDYVAYRRKVNRYLGRRN